MMKNPIYLPPENKQEFWHAASNIYLGNEKGEGKKKLKNYPNKKHPFISNPRG